MDVEAVLEQLRAAAELRGADWLQESVTGLLQAAPEAPPPSPSVRPRRSRTAAPRYSPEASPRSRRRMMSPPRDPPQAARGSAARSSSAGRGRNHPTRRGPTGGEGLYVGAAASLFNPPCPMRQSTRSPAAPLRASQVGEPACQPDQVSRRQNAVRSAGVPIGRQEAGPSHQAALRQQKQAVSRRGQACQRVTETAQRQERTEPAPEEPAEEGELREQLRPAGRSTAPAQPGEETPAFSLSYDNTDSTVGGSGEKRGDTMGDILTCLRGLVDRWDRGMEGRSGASGPVTAWTGQAEQRQRMEIQVPGQTGGGGDVAVQTDPPPAAGAVHLDDRARGEVYVCFEGPLGAHLKQEVKEKIWRDEYVEIFSLLPLEKFHLDRVRREEGKLEEEKERRYRLIPQNHSNWLQAFAIFASVVGEKAPENCSRLFRYMDVIGEMHRAYGGQAWLRYDELFRQRRAVRPALAWDQKDISLWLWVTGPGRNLQSFPGSGGFERVQAGTAGAMGPRKGLCWQYNEAQCRFGFACKFRHECSLCGGTSHGASRCVRRLRRGGGNGNPMGQRQDTSSVARDAPVPR